nr:GyrI-like domain-containing protein [Aerococcus sp. 1KP-2016]
MDGHLFVVNEAVDNKMMHSVGVQSDHEIDGTVQITRFPAGKYFIIEDKADDRQTLNDLLTYAAFGQVLNEITDYAYEVVQMQLYTWKSRQASI